jgi:hypothetical protein
MAAQLFFIRAQVATLEERGRDSIVSWVRTPVISSMCQNNSLLTLSLSWHLTNGDTIRRNPHGCYWQCNVTRNRSKAHATKTQGEGKVRTLNQTELVKQPCLVERNPKASLQIVNIWNYVQKCWSSIKKSNHARFSPWIFLYNRPNE